MNEQKCNAFCSSLSNCTNISSLTLQIGCNRVDDQKASQIGAALANCKNLRKLTVWLSYNMIDSQGISNFGFSLIGCNNLTELSLALAENKIGSEGASNLGEALSSYKHLEILTVNLFQNNILEQGASKLIEALTNSISLKSLTLGLNGNKIQTQNSSGLVTHLARFKRLQHLSIDLSLAVGLLMLIVGYYLGFCIIFNYAMGIFVHPGKSNVKRHRNYQLNGLDESDEDDDPNNFVNIQDTRPKICRKCNDFKPLRAHHCSICNECIYKMDHHCPWLDNCVGYENHRYFLSFIFYLMVSTFYLSCLFFYIDHHSAGFREAKRVQTKIFPVVQLLCYVLSFVLLAFNGWNWYLAMKGYTAVEFWGSRSDGKEPSDYAFQYPTISQNLYHIFGTYSYFKMLLPSIRALPHDGTKWECLSQQQRQTNIKPDIEEQYQARNRQTQKYQDEVEDEEEEQKFNSFERNNIKDRKIQYQGNSDDDMEDGL